MPDARTSRDARADAGIEVTAVVGADRAYYDHVQALTGSEGAAVTFPSYCAERRFQLVGNQMQIGRRSVSRGLAPEIDLIDGHGEHWRLADARGRTVVLRTR